MKLDENELAHYGILRRSGRYPWGSGDDWSPDKRHKTFLDHIEDLKRRLGWSNKEVADHLGISTTKLLELKTIAKAEQKAAQIGQAQRLQEKGVSGVAGAAKMGMPESSYRALLAPGAADKLNVLNATKDVLKKEVDEKTLLDVGKGTENYLGVSKERKDRALAMLVEDGYQIQYVKMPQLGTDKETTVKVLAPSGMSYSEIYKRRGEIRNLQSFSDDGGRSYYGIMDPLSVHPKRLKVRYGEEGGSTEDGVIYVRPGVSDLSLGGARYAQVRIKIGDDHYIKGMAIYKDDLPQGTDLVFNTSKSKTDNKLDALKPLKEDPDNPFGSYIKRQLIEKDADGNERLISAMNIVNEEGNWGGGSINPKTGEVDKGWSKTIASQVLSKQSLSLAKNQLDMTFGERQREFDEIMSLTNPTVRRKLLEEFAEGTDASAVHLAAACIPRQRWQVILPVNTLSDTEVYAPNFRDGERVALIRYPHGGTFEIPDLIVNNRHSDSKKILGPGAKDAIGINTKVAERLSGADFDGDTVLVIPNNQRRIRITPALKQLQGFDPRSDYKAYDGMRTIDGGYFNAVKGIIEYGDKGPNLQGKQREMGDVSNLITDMTIKGASHDEIAHAVRHSMVVIDAEKHVLNHRQSALDHGIAKLKAKYQGGPRAGADTLISLATSEVRVLDRELRRASKGGPVDKATGKKVYEYSGRTYVNKKGKLVPSIKKSTRLAEEEDAHVLSSGTPMERLYADHSNKLKNMANKARREAVNTPRATYSASAAKTYTKQVDSLLSKLDLVNRNKPLERQALILANAILKQKVDANPNMDNETKKKIKFQILEEQRNRTKARRHRIEITPDEWKAIQAGAISDTRLNAILTSANMDTVRQHATPRVKLLMTPAKTARAQDMLKLGFTRAEVADKLGVSLTTLDEATGGG